MATELPTREAETSAIVFLGSFNPAIFQPSWLASVGLLREAEAEAATVHIIHAEVAALSTSWLELQVTRDQFLAASQDSNGHELVRDFAAGVFRLLEHTPLRSAGLNHAYHYAFPSYELNERLGAKIVPSEPWPFLDDPKFMNLQVTSARTEGRPGQLNVQLQPSVKFQGGLFIAVNDHFDLEQNDKPIPALAGVELLAECWDASREKAEEVVNGLMANLDDA